MSTIFWVLLILTAAFGGGFVYRLSASTRRYNLDRDQKVGVNYGIASDEARAVDFDMFLLRWTFIFAVLMVIWGLGEAAVRLLT